MNDRSVNETGKNGQSLAVDKEVSKMAGKRKEIDLSTLVDCFFGVMKNC